MGYGKCPECGQYTLIFSDVYGAYCVSDDCDYQDQALD